MKRSKIKTIIGVVLMTMSTIGMVACAVCATVFTVRDWNAVWTRGKTTQIILRRVYNNAAIY